jgi:uncharacterized protein YutE (UPF0331/DUF86 family)
MDKQKKDNKKPTNNFEIEKLNSYKNCKLDIQNLQKISEKVEQTGLVALVGLGKKIVSFYNEISENCEKNKLKTTDYFNLTSIRKYLYDLVDYPQTKDADGKPIRNYVFENAVSRSIKIAFVLINKEKTKAEIKDGKLVAQSNIIYPHLKTSGNGDIKFTPNKDESLISVSTRGLEMLWNTIAPKKPNKKPTTPDENVSILDTYKSIRKILNDEILTRQKNPKYLVDKYGISEVEQLRKIAQFALRLVEQKDRDSNDFDTNGTMKNANVVSIEKVEFKVKDHKNLELTRVSKVS